MKKILFCTALLLISLLSLAQPEPNINIQLRFLQKAAGPGEFPLTNAQGIQKYRPFVSINTTPLPANPLPTGNTNFNQFVSGPTGDVYYIDWIGNSILLSSAPATAGKIVYDNRDTIRQISHGFSLSSARPFIPLHQAAGGWVEANTINQLPSTNIVEIINADSFVTMVNGPLWSTTHTLDVRSWLFLQDDGTVAATPDADYSVAMAYCPDASTVWLYDPLASTLSGGSGSVDYTASQALQLIGNDFRFGGPTRVGAVPITGSRVVRSPSTGDYIELYNEILGSDVNSLRLTASSGEGSFNNLYFENTTGGVTGSLGLSASGNFRLRSDGVITAVAAGTVVTNSGANFHSLQVPLIFQEYAPGAATGTIAAGALAFVLSDGSVGRQGEVYAKSGSDTYLPITEQIISQTILEQGTQLTVAPTNWTYTVPSIYDGLKLKGVIHSFASTGDGDTGLSVQLGSTPLDAIYGTTLTAGQNVVSVFPDPSIAVSTGDVIRGRVTSIAGTTTPEGWTNTLIFGQ